MNNQVSLLTEFDCKIMDYLDNFMVRASLAGLGVALAAAPLGCFVVWRRMAYFGDATAHVSLLGVALALVLHLPITVGVLFVTLSMAVIVTLAVGRDTSESTMLGVIAYSSIALALVLVAMIPNVRIDLMSFLFGDILAVDRLGLAIIWSGLIIVLTFIICFWTAMLTSTLNAEFAISARYSPRMLQLMLSILLALLVTISIKVVGILLIGAMLIIPPAAARYFSSTPEQMALLAALIGTCSALGGLALSYLFDTTTGPTIVCVAAFIFVVSRLGSIALGRQ